MLDTQLGFYTAQCMVGFVKVAVQPVTLTDSSCLAHACLLGV